jgi:Zn-dependent metalloprotease
MNRLPKWAALASLFLALLLARDTVGQPAASAAARDAWAKLSARNSLPASVSWNERTAAAKAIFGVFSEPSPEASEAHAREFLAENADLFALTGDTADLALTRVVESPMGRHFVFAQRHRGIPVDGAEVKVHYDVEGRVVAVNNGYEPGLRLGSVTPRVTLDRAIAALGAALPSSAAGGTGAARAERLRDALPAATGTLVVRPSASGARLAWKVEIPTSEETWEAFVDARSGRLVGEPRDVNRYINGTGQVFRVNAVVATQDNSLRDDRDSAAAVPATAYEIVTLQGLTGNGHLDGVYASSSRSKKPVFSAGHDFVFDRSQDGFSETMGYYYLDYAQRYIQSLGFSNVNNRQQAFSVNRFKKDNSFYSPGTKDLTFGTGGVDDAEDADVILHEYGHSIQDNQVPGFGSTAEAGAMGEGFGDYWAGSVGAQTSGGFQDTCLAEWDATSYSSTNPPCLRRLDGTKHYPQDVVGEVHADGEIWSAALWQVRDALGPAKADLAILQHHFLISADASFNQAANALVTAAINLGYSTAEVDAIRAILRARGFTVTA